MSRGEGGSVEVERTSVLSCSSPRTRDLERPESAVACV